MCTTGINDTGGKFATRIVDTSGQFSTGINNTSETGGKICSRCRWYQRHLELRISARIFKKIQNGGKFAPDVNDTLSCEYLREFLKKFETALMVYTQGLGGNWFMKKIISWKSRDTVPLIILM